MESEIPNNIKEKLKREFERSPDFLRRKLRGDYKNIKPHGTSIPNVFVFGVGYELREYEIPLLDTEGRPVLDESGGRDFRIIGIYFSNGEPYTFHDLLNEEKK